MIFFLQNSVLYVVKYEEDDYDRCRQYLIPPEPLDGWKGYMLEDIEIKSMIKQNNDDEEFEVIARYLHEGEDLPGNEKELTIDPREDLKNFSFDRFNRKCVIFGAIIAVLSLIVTIIIPEIV